MRATWLRASIGIQLPLLLTALANAQVRPRNIEIVFDCSGSMETRTTRFTSFQDKVEIAKDEVKRFVSSLPPGTSVALRVFGTDRAAGCQDTKLLYPLKAVDVAAVVASLDPIRPAFHGKTPIARSLEEALRDFQAAGAVDADNSIILLTDGVESCGGNVDAAIDRIRDAGINLKVHIVGFDVLSPDNPGVKEELETMAARTGGSAEFPKTKAELEESLAALAPQPATESAPPPPSGMARIASLIRENVVVVTVLGVVLFSLGIFLALRARGWSDTDPYGPYGPDDGDD